MVAPARRPFHALSRFASIFTRLVNFCWLLFQWSLVLAVAAALVVGGYLYLWLDDEILRQVQDRLAGHYQGLIVKVGAARFEQDRGIAIDEVSLFRAQPDGTLQSIISIEQMFLAGKIRTEELIAGKLSVEQITIRRARLHAIRQLNGQGNDAAILPVPKFSDARP